VAKILILIDYLDIRCKLSDNSHLPEQVMKLQQAQTLGLISASVDRKKKRALAGPVVA
jgi:hypothetical protein